MTQFDSQPMNQEPIPPFADSPYPSQADTGHVAPWVRLHELLEGRYIWATILGVVLSIMAGTLAYTRFTPRYQSTGMVQIKPVVKPILYQTDQNGVMPMFDAFMDTQVAILRDQRTIRLAMDSSDWQAALAKWGPYSLANFIANLNVSRGGGEELIQVSFIDGNPERAKVAVKVVEDAYKSIAEENDNTVDSNNMKALEDLRTSLTGKLKGFNDEILTIANDFGTDDMQQILQPKLARVSQLAASLQEAQIMLAALQSDANATTQPVNISMEPEHLTPEIVASRGDSIMTGLLGERQQTQENISQLRARFGPTQPVLAAALVSLRTIDEEINSRMADYQTSSTKPSAILTADPGGGPPDQQVKQMQRRVLELQRLYELADKDLLAVGLQANRMGSLKQEVERTQQDLNNVRSHIDQINVEAPAVSGRIKILSPGDTPQQPMKDRNFAVTVASAMAGLVSGFLVVAGIGALDRRVKSVAQAETAFDSSRRILGILPALPDDLADPEQAASAAYCVHHIRALLQIGAGRNPHPIIAVTSAAPGDGKTSFVFSLGLSYAATGTKTLLIDFDVVAAGLTHRADSLVRSKIGDLLVREGRLTPEGLSEALAKAKQTGKQLGETLIALGMIQQADLDRALAAQRETNLGVLDVLDGEPLAKCILESETPHLSILTVGNVGAKHVGQLSVAEVNRILAEARKVYDVVLIDTGPILGSLEACIVTAAADEVILVVSRGQQKSLIQKAFEFLGDVNAKIAGIVFNRAKPEDMERSGGYSSYHMSHSLRSPVIGETLAVNGGTSRFGPVAQAVAMSEAAASRAAPLAVEDME